jgi:AAA domain, putative AbiEii toxin, Type IV TA system/AAA ATPase domain
MIDQLNISNFRCFDQLSISDLKRVNLIVGENSSGKSAFLEAIFISSASNAPSIAFQIRGIRRMGNQIIVPNDALAYRGMWEDLFYNFDEGKKVTIRVIGNPAADGRSLSIEYVTSAGVQELPFGKQALSSRDNAQQQTGAMPQVEFTWKRANFPQVVSRPAFTPNGLQLDVSRLDFFPCVWFTAGGAEAPDENARRFSELDKRGETEVILDVLAREFSFIKGLSIDYHAGVPMVFASVEGKPRKLPVPLISDGVNRLLGICLGIATYKSPTILIDQIEDGFHHKILPSIWKSIYSLAKIFNAQLFISTHSQECIEAMLPILKGNEDEFSLLRAVRKEAGCTIKTLTGKYLESAVEQEFEVR